MLRADKIIVFVVCLFFLAACSTKKNTGFTRSYHSFATKYNIRHNAINAFEDGQKSLLLATQDDYSQIIPLYPTVNKQTSGNISSRMDIVIEKCRKAIKNHSIKSKPKGKPIGMSSEEYRKFRLQEEFNPQVPKAWLLLGQAEYYKADFVDATSDFNYIIRHYSEQEPLVCEAKLWIVRAYTDMGWTTEAESHLQSIKESSVPQSLKHTHAAFSAHLLISMGEYEKAVSYLKKAIEKPKNKYEKSRFNFVLAQIYEKLGNKKNAQSHYSIAKSSATNYEMIFNASLKESVLNNNAKKAINELEKMAKSDNNTNYLDQIYFAIGEKYMSIEQTSRAIESYQKAMIKSTRGGVEKALAALKIAQLYYEDKNYIESASYYDSVIISMPNTHSEYREAEKRSQVLGQLAQNYQIATLQDSLVTLSYKSEAEQLLVIDKIIAELIEAEKQAAIDSANRAAMEVAKQNETTSYMNPLGQSALSSQDWYFYNTQAVNLGKADFRKKWGNRPIEDNWRRSTKTISQSENSNNWTAEDSTQYATEATDSLSDDPHRPEYYLSQIPKTDEERSLALEQVATALYNMGSIFHTQLDDLNSADATYREFQSRFISDERIPETYFLEYQINGKLQNTESQEVFRQKLLREFPYSKYAIMLSSPDYEERIKQMLASQDSLYKASYTAYRQGNTQEVIDNFQIMSDRYPMSEFMPKFALLNALSLGKQGYTAMFEAGLDTIISRYPDSEVTPLSKNILALVKQGREQQLAENTIDTLDLSQRRTVQFKQAIIAEDSLSKPFEFNITEPHIFILLQKSTDTKILNSMLYDIAAYNFNKFQIKDYDFDLQKFSGKSSISISGLETLEEAIWYRDLLEKDEAFAGVGELDKFEIFIVAQSAIRQIHSEQDLIIYRRFIEERNIRKK